MSDKFQAHDLFSISSTRLFGVHYGVHTQPFTIEIHVSQVDPEQPWQPQSGRFMVKGPNHQLSTLCWEDFFHNMF